MALRLLGNVEKVDKVGTDEQQDHESSLNTILQKLIKSFTETTASALVRALVTT